MKHTFSVGFISSVLSECISSSILLGYITLFGIEDVDYEIVDNDSEWWALHLLFHNN